jgi:hypothetical protein
VKNCTFSSHFSFPSRAAGCSSSSPSDSADRWSEFYENSDASRSVSSDFSESGSFHGQRNKIDAAACGKSHNFAEKIP